MYKHFLYYIEREWETRQKHIDIRKKERPEKGKLEIKEEKKKKYLSTLNNLMIVVFIWGV